ncbi:Fanconi anemia group J-like protein [Morus notabilis]|uniref:Fanconi anemia group J-like protein n=1 Tax=Morus notabilis TaxID=981085 RepID=W9R744_9ROSA|nr:Fanconi anemia group J-like protein [Morus notabilis]
MKEFMYSLLLYLGVEYIVTTSWTGDKALKELQEANISQQSFPILLECAAKAIEDASDTESTAEIHLTGMAVMTLEGLFSSLTYFFSRDGFHTDDYQLAVRKYVKKDAGKAFGDWTYTLSLWCLNPAVVFKDIAQLSLSVILTSGTLSPMNSFSSELGVQFGTSLEAAHVIDNETQDSLGKSLEEIFKVVPGGSLVFFPSYKLMEKLRKRWCETGQWSQLNANKSLFVEPRGASQEDFESVLKDYYDAIYGVNRPLSGRRKRIKSLKNNDLAAAQCANSTSTKGAALLAVCRGKVSEGIDFSDDNARMVVSLSNDILVSLKKKYNDAHKASKDLLSGNEWYCQQAFRALNQAAGRCIRHRSDYGAIIFLDERYQEERNRANISKWLRKSIRQYDNFDLIVEGLKSFFSNVKERVNKNMMNALQTSNTSSENVLSADQIKGSTTKRDQNFNKSDHSGQKELSLTRHNVSCTSLNSQDDMELQTTAKLNEDAENWQEVIDLCSLQNDSRYRTALSLGFSVEDPEVSIVKETPCAGDSITTESPRSFSKDVTGSVVSRQLLFDQQSSTDWNKSSPEAQCLTEVTPQKNAAVDTSRSMLEMESSNISSVNSCSQKRRKFISSSLVCLFEGQHDAADANASNCTNGEPNGRIDLGVETNCVEENFKSAVAQLLTMNDSAMDKRLRVHCSLCKTPLGLPGNHQYMMCYLTTSSKIHLESLHKEIVKPQHVRTSKGIPILVTDISSVYQRLFDRTLESNSERGIWCEKDGCVFNTIFCPFCSTHGNCLGVQVMATNASNIHLLNKILFYVDQLEIENLEESINKKSKGKDPLPVSASSMNEVGTLKSFDRFSYTPQENNSGGWRSTKSKHAISDILLCCLEFVSWKRSNKLSTTEDGGI